MSIKGQIQKFLWKFGYDVVNVKSTRRSFTLRRRTLMRSYNVNVVFDVGASDGGFAKGIRDSGYAGRMYSFEPVASAFASLQANAEDDAHWDVFNIALGDGEKKQEINVSQNSVSSSLLDMMPAHHQAAPASVYIAKEQVEVKTLDSIFGKFVQPTDKVYLKIDAQGSEGAVLRGAEKSLVQIDTVQIEMSLVPMYKDEWTFHEVHTFMNEKSYSLVAIVNVFDDEETGQILQVDGIFHRLQA